MPRAAPSKSPALTMTRVFLNFSKPSTPNWNAIARRTARRASGNWRHQGEGYPYEHPEFEALCREHGIWGTAESALCAVFWRGAQKPDGAGSPNLHHYGDVLQPFVHIMADELLANAGKGDRPGWLSCSADALMLEVYYHAAKLQKAVKDGNRDGIREYSADVANLAMMVLDVCGGIDAAISAQQHQEGKP